MGETTVICGTLREANATRQAEWDKDDRITLSYRGNEMAGEVGEACNIIKKLDRERMGIRGSRATVAQLAEELADVVICADLIAMHEGIDLDAAVAAKFNATSEKVGLQTRLVWADRHLRDEREVLFAEIGRLREAINTPLNDDWFGGVKREAVHQVERWSASHDAGKAPEDWFWLIGFLAGKALHAAKNGDVDKALHHTISTAAVLLNWHRALSGISTAMRPGIDPAERGISAEEAVSS